MKRWISILLALCLLLSLPVAAAQAEEEPEIVSGGESLLCTLPTVPVKRDQTVPHLETSPLMVDMTAKRGDAPHLVFISSNPTGSGVYYYGVEVYRGTQITEANLVGGYVNDFVRSNRWKVSIGFDTEELEMYAGTYTVAYYTFYVSGDTAYIFEDTVKTFPLKVVNYDIPLQSLGFYGIGDHLDVLCGTTDKTQITTKLVPSNTTVDREHLDWFYAGTGHMLYNVDACAGQFWISGVTPGTDYMKVELGDVSFTLQINVRNAPLTGMSFNPNEITVHAGQSYNDGVVRLGIYPSANFRDWKVYSENPEIADVTEVQSDFIVRVQAGKNGKTRIVAECEGIKAYLNVTVTPHEGEVLERVEPTATKAGYEIVNCIHEGCKNNPYENVLYPVFEDTDGEAWYSDGVDFVYEREFFKGVTETQFAPNKPMSRAMLVTVLWRVAGCPEAGAPAFADVQPELWYSTPVAWAAENGIVNGVNEETFAPDRNITREQLATILYRYAEFTGEDMELEADLSTFPDAEQVSAWASDAMQWCVAKGLIGGSNGKLLPQGNATRAQVATIIMRYLQSELPL